MPRNVSKSKGESIKNPYIKIEFHNKYGNIYKQRFEDDGDYEIPMGFMYEKAKELLSDLMELSIITSSHMESIMEKKND